MVRYPKIVLTGHFKMIWNEKRPLRNVNEGQGAGRRGELAVDSEGERSDEQKTWPVIVAQVCGAR